MDKLTKTYNPKEIGWLGSSSNLKTDSWSLCGGQQHVHPPWQTPWLGSPKAKGAAVAFVLGCLCFELKPASASLHGTFNIQIAACPKFCCSVKVY